METGFAHNPGKCSPNGCATCNPPPKYAFHGADPVGPPTITEQKMPPGVYHQTGVFEMGCDSGGTPIVAEAHADEFCEQLQQERPNMRLRFDEWRLIHAGVKAAILYGVAWERTSYQDVPGEAARNAEAKSEVDRDLVNARNAWEACLNYMATVVAETDVNGGVSKATIAQLRSLAGHRVEVEAKSVKKVDTVAGQTTTVAVDLFKRVIASRACIASGHPDLHYEIANFLDSLKATSA